MIKEIRQNGLNWHNKLLPGIIISGLLLLAIALGTQASPLLLAAILALIALVGLLRQPILGLLGVIVAALILPLEIGTGSEVALNPASLLIPAMVGLWIVTMILSKKITLVPSPTNLPLFLFLAAGLLSLLIGNALWDTAVPRPNNFILVQLAQWAIFAFSACAFLLTGNLIRNRIWLRRLLFTFLIVAGTFAILRYIPFVSTYSKQLDTEAFIRAPLWALLGAMAVGQLLFNKKLSFIWRAFLILVFIATLIFTLIEQQEVISNWMALIAVIGTLVWLRWPRLRWPTILIVGILLLSGNLFSAVWQFAGGENEWLLSGGSRLALAQRVIEDTMRNPITGLGPAAYRVYGATRPLNYRHIIWYQPRISSHNNYVDLFSQTGLVGLILFFWFVVEMTKLGLRLRQRYSTGFEAGFVNGILAAGVGSLVLMAFADWILPFVYNIGFPGFQASVLVWLMMGGLVALNQLPPPETDQN